jgi:hypothetical protein
MTKTKPKPERKIEGRPTAGPWAFEEGDREKRDMARVFKANDREFLIAYVLCDWRNELARADDIANARLIAAAPKLAEALGALVRYLVDTEDTALKILRDEAAEVLDACQ